MSNPERNRLHRETLRLHVPEIYACATTGSGQAWVAAYDDHGRCWGAPVECRLAVIDTPGESKITFTPTPGWHPKKRMYPPLRAGIILGDPRNSPVHFISFVSKTTYERLNPSRRDTLWADHMSIAVATTIGGRQ